jgi:hypothetical protein
VLYSYFCECGKEEDRFCPVEERHSQTCECGLPLKKRVTGLKLVGPTDTKPTALGGKALVTSSQVSAWENANPGCHVLPKSDRRVKDTIRDGRHEVELKAQAKGYRSERHRQEEVKREGRAKGELIG